MDQAIFSFAGSKADLSALDLPDVQLDDYRRRFVRLLDRYTVVLRAFAAVMKNNDGADAEDAMDGMRALEPDERALVEDIVRYCRQPS